MVYAGAVAAGAFAGHDVVLFGAHIDSTFWALHGDGAGGDARLLARFGDRLGASASTAGGPSSSADGRWVHVDAGEPRPRRGVVRPLRRLGGVVRAGRARRALVHLHPCRRARDAARALHGPHRDRLGDLVLRTGGRRAGRRDELGAFPRAAAATRTTSSRSSSARSSSTSWCGSCAGERAAEPWKRRPKGRVARVAIPLTDVRAQYAPLLDELKDRIAGVLDSGRFILGPKVEAFQEEAARYLGVRRRDRRRERDGCARARPRRARRRARRRSHLPLLHVLRDRRVDRPPWRHPGLRGHRPVHAEPRPGRRRGQGHRADEGGLAVHLFGRPLDVSALPDSIPVVEDAAQAFGAAHGRAPVGSAGAAGTFSFYPTKNLFGLGDGGLVTTSDPDLADARAPAPLPRLPRQGDLRGGRLQLAARRATGCRAPHLPPPRRRLECEPPCCGGSLRRARPRRGLRAAAATSRGTCTTCTSCARPSASG